MSISKSLYFFGNGSAEGDGTMRETLGGKGANLAEMSKIGVPVPCGFTISTKECAEYYANDKKISHKLMENVKEYIHKIEKETGFIFGSDSKPLLVSVRSGAKFSMPGMMDTILNLGLNDTTVKTLAKITNNERFAYDSYRRFIQMYASVVLEVDHHKFESIIDDVKLAKGVINDIDLDSDDMAKIILRYKDLIHRETGVEFQQDVFLQLENSIDAVFRSWMNERAIIYRKLHGISDECGTAVNIQSMVFGNMGSSSATGVAFTRNPSTGENKVYGEYLINAQGEDVVAGIRTPKPLLASEGQDSMQEVMPKVYAQLTTIFQILESHYKDMQDVEFTVQEGKLWILQTRNGKRVAKAAVKIAVDMVKEGFISKQDAIMKVDASSLDQLLHPVLDRSAALNVIARGLPASPGAVSGCVVFNSKDAENMRLNHVDSILVRNETSPEDIGGMHASVGILTAKGGMTSHAAVVARGMGKPCISGCDGILINQNNKTIQVSGSEVILKEGDMLTIDGSTGEVILGKAKTTTASGFLEFETLMSWADEIRDIQIRVNAETKTDCEVGVKFGAQGIGLCRTEHMFFDKEKLIAFRKMIFAKSQSERKIILEEIGKMQVNDFVEILEVMNGLPTNIRLLDPPLHEFLPHTASEISAFSEQSGLTKEYILQKLSDLHEQNPMLGHRGSRLGITYPEIFEMQVSSIFEAAIKVKQSKGIDPILEIMLPIIIEEKEIALLSASVRKIATEKLANSNVPLKYKIGTMIEIPRACLVADEIAKHVDYFSFGTNDLTQTTLGISRDDAAKFLVEYINKGILDCDPFVTVDKKGVGAIMKIAIEKAKKAKPDLTISVCGEHGGDAKSIEFFATLGVNYVSCSPYRVPLARLTAAQAKIAQKS